MELSLYAALKRDPQGLALHFYRNGEPHGDVQGEEAFIARYYLYSLTSPAPVTDVRDFKQTTTATATRTW